MGLTMEQVGADISSLLSGNFVNRFNLDGRSYKVIPQVERQARLTPRAARRHLRHGPAQPAHPARRDRHAAHQRPAAHAQSLPAAQRDQDLGRPDALARRRVSACSKRPPREILPPGYHLDYTGESRQLRQEGGKFLPAMGLALLVIFLVLAAQFNSFRDPFVILAGLGAARDVRRADLHVPQVPGPARDVVPPDARAGPPRSTSTRRSAWSRWSA